MGKIKEVIILAEARTGSSYFLDLFKFFKKTSIKEEIFNHENFNLSYDELKENKERFENTILKEKYEKIKKENSEKILIHKIIVNNLSDKFIEEIIKEENKLVVVIQRNPKDSFISLMKAIKIKKWHNVNTTNISLNKSEIENYQEYKPNFDKIYKKITELTKKANKKPIYFEYEELMSLKTDFERAKYLKIKINRELDYNLLEFKNQFFIKLKRRTRMKQDLSKNKNLKEKLEKLEKENNL